MASLEDSGDGPTDELIEVDADGECPSKPEEGNVKPRARFGRCRTHNEQLVVATCGVIIGRATMFGSEGIDGVCVCPPIQAIQLYAYTFQMFLHALYPTKASVPQVLFYDNACSLKKHLLSVGDDHFDQCTMPVDPFHAKTKHRDDDDFCNQICNAARFPDLLVNGKWCFNSSAAEMTNAWFRGFQSIVREMRAAYYDFFLDEMIKIRNHTIIHDQQVANKHPHEIPRELLLNGF